MTYINPTFQKDLDAAIQKAKSAVVLIDIPENLSQKQKAQIVRLNKKLLLTAEKRAKAEFAEKIASRMAQKKRAQLAQLSKNRTQRKRREHLIFTLGAEILRSQHFERGFIKNLLLNGRRQDRNKLISELNDFCHLAFIKCNYSLIELNQQR